MDSLKPEKLLVGQIRQKKTWQNQSIAPEDDSDSEDKSPQFKMNHQLVHINKDPFEFNKLQRSLTLQLKKSGSNKQDKAMLKIPSFAPQSQQAFSIQQPSKTNQNEPIYVDKILYENYIEEKDSESLTSFGSPLPNLIAKNLIKDDISAIPPKQHHFVECDQDFSFIGKTTNHELFSSSKRSQSKLNSKEHSTEITKKEAARSISKQRSHSPKLQKGSSKENKILERASDKQFQIRWLQRTDYNQGNSFQLLDKYDFQQKYDSIFPQYQNLYKMVVVQDMKNRSIIASGTLMIELKVQSSKTAHIEDFNVEQGYSNQKIGSRLMAVLTNLAWENGCQKTMVQSHSKNSHFYENCGYQVKGQQLCIYKKSRQREKYTKVEEMFNNSNQQGHKKQQS